ncbi:unnamed protein product [Parnassius mnemosyne]|uniref:Carboxylic ester hydrolase n=1 Tax=Parnassius mnemosyne TaxID=213953 RepID=A0AAV1KDC2_9NEOP
MKCCKFLKLLFVTIIFIEVIPPTCARVVNTTSGPVQGLLNHWHNLDYYSYLGIPYAESPVGKLRFMPPVPKKSWKRILDATQEGPVCPQGHGPQEPYKIEEMSEDCLFLNIHIPANVQKNKLSVFVFVHGGTFRLLSGNSDVLYGPQLFLEQGLIFVTMNFRLGALGFLSLDIEEASGNAGLKDVILALKWINNNIERFGGDRNKITIGGHSSGASAVHYLLLTQQASDLFQRAILISGSAVSHRFIARHAKDNTLILAKELGLMTDDVHELLKKLQEIKVFDLIDAELNLTKYDDVVLRPFSMFVPTIEINSLHAVITSDPIKLLNLGLVQNIPILVGFNYREGIYGIPKIMQNKDKLKKLKENMEYSIPSDIEYPLGSKISKDLAKSISQYYFNSDLSNFTLNNIVDLISDSQYIYSIDSWIKKYKKVNGSNSVYYYMFNFDGDLNWSKINYNIDFPGTSHADELGYIFITKKTKDMLNKIDCNSHLVKNIMTTLFSNFIKFGKPTPQNLASNYKWPEYGKNGTFLIINENPTEGTLSPPLLARLKFWYDVYETYYNYVENGGKLEAKNIP